MMTVLMESLIDYDVLANEISATHELSDDELAAAARLGDEKAFQILFERHRYMVARLALRFFQRREQVEEIIQETFTKVFFALGTYRGGYELSFSAWLSKIAVRACYDELRRVKRRSESNESDLDVEESTSLQARFESHQSGDRIEGETISRDLAEKLLSKLSPEDRMVLMLVNGEEIPVAEVARLTGWSVGKVKTRTMRARNSLRRILHKFL